MSVKIRSYPGGRYEADIRFTLPNGDVFRRRLVVPVTSASAAKRWAEAKERDLFAKATRGEGDLPKVIKTLTEFAPEFLDRYARANRQKPSGVAAKETIINKHLVPAFGHKRLNEITDLDVDNLKAAMAEKKLHPKTVNNVLSVLSKMLKVAVRWKQIVEVPVRIELLSYQRKEMEFYSLDTYSKLLRAAEAMEPEDELLVRAGGDAGLRRGEIIGLTDKAIDMERGMLVISTNIVRGEVGGTKGLKVRELPMSDELRSLLARCFNGRKGHLLAQENGEPESAKMLRTRMGKIQKVAGIENKGSLHILRHTYCSHLAMGGVPVVEIQRLAGHAHLSTTMQYMHLAPNAGLRDAMDKLAAIRGKSVGGRNGPQLRVMEGGATTKDDTKGNNPEIDQGDDAPDASTHR